MSFYKIYTMRQTFSQELRTHTHVPCEGLDPNRPRDFTREMSAAHYLPVPLYSPLCCPLGNGNVWQLSLSAWATSTSSYSNYLWFLSFFLFIYFVFICASHRNFLVPQRRRPVKPCSIRRDDSRSPDRLHNI